MCGIFGFIGSVAEETAALCTDTLAHRGPDGRGLWCGNGIVLGHRRLSIIDLSTNGSQPMSYADGRYWITYNGEIYNFIELRNQLQTLGYSFKSDSDTEVILAAFVAWGEECLNRFNGMWSFAIWDSSLRTLFLSRDRFGKKPLFYAGLSTGFAFASEMKAFFPLMQEVRPNVALVRDRKQIFQYESTDECLIEGIKRFPAGHYGYFKDGRLSLQRWWCTLDHLPEIPHRYEEQVEQFRELFVDACRLRMRSDVPIGTALSGGLDSSATISVMSYIVNSGGAERISPDWQHAFVACFPGTSLDESYYARLVTEHLGITTTFLDINPLAAIDRLNNYLYLFEDIYITSPLPFMMTYGAMPEQGVKVTIDGHGADELFGGYPFDYLHTLVDAGIDPAKVKAILTTYYDTCTQSAQFRLPPKWIYWLKWHATRLAKKIVHTETKPDIDCSHPLWARLDTLNRILYASTHTNVLPTLLRNYDRYSMANGVEIRMPFMDHRIVGFAFALPWQAKLRGGYSKAIIRDAVAPFMPHEVAYRKSKIGFNSPIVDWIKGPLKPFFCDTIASRSFLECQLIDPMAVAAKVRQVIDDPKASFNMGEQAWAMLSPYLWEQAVIKRSVGWSRSGTKGPL